MGNTISAQDENFHDDAGTKTHVKLESPEVDTSLNSGVDSAKCQPKNLQSELKQGQKLVVEEGLEVVMKSEPEVHLGDGKSEAPSSKHGGVSSVSDNGEDRRKRQQSSQSQQQQTAKKLSYVQMAKLGYQELVNAIIRPPRADYKVC